MNVGKRIRECREEAKLTQPELARLCGINRFDISKFELGRKTPGLCELYQLAEPLGVSIEYLEGSAEPVFNHAADFVKIFRELPDKDRKRACDYIKFLYKRRNK